VPAPTEPQPPASQGRFWIVHAVLPLLSAAVLLAVFEGTRLDQAVLDPFFDSSTRTFPLRDSDWFSLVFKDGMKDLVIAFGALVAVAFVASFRNARLAPWRRRLGFVFLCLALGPLIVAAFKYSSCKHCPWDLAMYGGTAPYANLLGCPPPGFGKGHCFPSGHASGGFALFALYFAFRDVDPRRARNWFWIAIAYGLVMGTARMMQGAHFLSHAITTAYVCWFVCLGLYELVLCRSRAPAAQTVASRA
jgi:membrane-associated PAP2 superfamily phosphatase